MTADLVLLIAALPFILWAAWTDLKYMKLYNVMNLALFGTFVFVGILVLPFAEYALRIGIGMGVLVVGIFLTSIGQFGGGDAKYLAALIPFIDPDHLADFCFILSVTLLLALVMHRMMRNISALRRATPGWVSWESRKFPAGFGFSGGFLLYLVLRAFNSSVSLG